MKSYLIDVLEGLDYVHNSGKSLKLSEHFYINLLIRDCS